MKHFKVQLIVSQLQKCVSNIPCCQMVELGYTSLIIRVFLFRPVDFRAILLLDKRCYKPKTNYWYL